MTIQGGYNASCATRNINATLTILDGDTDADTTGNGVTLDMAMLNSNSTGNITVEGCTVRNGYNAYDEGGCIRIYTDRGDTIISGNIISNCVSIRGGSLGIKSNSGNELIVNNIIFGNAVSEQGGGRICNDSSWQHNAFKQYHRRQRSN